MLNFTVVQNALAQLEKSLSFCNSELAKNDIDIFIQFRSAAIQAFEYTYELSIKMLRRKLKEIEPSSQLVEELAYNDLIRKGAQRGFIDNPETWFKFRAKRNITSHTYEENKAVEVYEILPLFVEKAKILINNLKR